jgi:Heparinase II/III-like protein/Heparinase II/III N-terminus
MLLTEIQNKKTSVAQVAPRRVFCVIEHAYQNLEIARNACAGRFTIAGTTLDLGSRINWLENPHPADEEWQIEWHKFYYGLDLAQSYRKSGDAKFLQTWERLVRSWIRQVPVGFDSTDVLARRVQNWIYAWQIFAESKIFRGLSGNLDREILTSIAEQTRYLRENLTRERNHRTLELYALFVVALSLPQLDRKSELLRFAMRELHENLLTDIRADGVHREHSTHYHATVLRSFLGARENARRFGLKFPDGFDERLIKACEFLMHIHRPDGEIPAISDSDTGSYLDLLKLAGEIFARPDFLYAATKGRQGFAPEKCNADFCEGGYFTQRSGWGEGENSFENERFLIFDCGNIGDGGHGHYDALSVEIAANGKPLIVDIGRYTYAEDSGFNWRHYFKGTAAHNTISIDDKDQTAYRRGKPKENVAQAHFIERISRADLDVLCGKVESPNYEAVHTRRIFFIRNEYWLIADNLRGLRLHKYDLRFHLSPAAWNHSNLLTTENNSVVRTPDIALIFDKKHAPKIEPSWFSPKYGVKHRASCVSVVEENVSSADFYTLVVPLDIKQDLPEFNVKNDGAKITFEISGVGEKQRARDVLTFHLKDERCVIEEFFRSEETK